MSLDRQFLDHLPVIDQVVQFIGRRHRLAADAIEELQSSIHLKIIDNDYEVLRRFLVGNPALDIGKTIDWPDPEKGLERPSLR